MSPTSACMAHVRLHPSSRHPGVESLSITYSDTTSLITIQLDSNKRDNLYAHASTQERSVVRLADIVVGQRIDLPPRRGPLALRFLPASGEVGCPLLPWSIWAFEPILVESDFFRCGFPYGLEVITCPSRSHLKRRQQSQLPREGKKCYAMLCQT